MILTKNVKPENLLFYKASFILQILLEKKAIDVEELFILTASKVKMTYSSYVKCLDWLFLLSAINVKDVGGKLECSLND